MVGVRLTTGYIHRPKNPADQIELAYSDLAADAGARGSVGQYAGGVRRIISHPGSEPSLEIEAPHVLYSVAKRLDSWVSEGVVWRDLQGRVVWGMLESVDYDWNPSYRDDRVASITLKILPTTQTAKV